MDVKILSIDTIGLSVRAANALHRAKIHTVGDMLEYSEETLGEIRNLGKKSIGEIIEKIKEYKRIDEEGRLPDKTENNVDFSIPEDFEEWIMDLENQKLVGDWLREKEIRIEILELLPVKAFNLLMFAGYDFIYQIAFMSQNKLMEIPRMDVVSASEIEKNTAHYIREIKDEIFSSIEKKCNIHSEPKPISIYELLSIGEYKDSILQYVKANDMEIEKMYLSNRPKNRLLANGYSRLSDIVFITRSELQKIPCMGVASVEEIIEKGEEYFAKNEKRIMAVIRGDENALWDDEAIKKMILDQYTEIGFQGLSLNDFVSRLKLSEQISVDRLKAVIGQLIADEKLEYVDYRCYRIYGKFEKYLNICPAISERNREFISRRLKGETLESIAKDNNLTRERVRQIVKKDIEKVRNYYFAKTGMSLFDEDYFKYLYETYAFEKEDAAEWLGVPVYVWNYLDLNDVKRGKTDLQKALEDYHELDLGLRLKIKNYLNRNKLYVDGRWVEKKRSDLEQVVVRKFCTEDVCFDEFCQLYNSFLEQKEIPYDDNIYYTNAVYRTRKNRLADARFLLWKQNEQMRYYDIDGRDYTELLDTLNMDSYENIEFSTAKFMRNFPEIMEKYDVRDQYELHNLLRKIVPEGSYHDFHCGRMPEIRFGTFDRDGAILDILIDNAPISGNDLAKLINEEYGYDTSIIMAGYLKNFSEYKHQGIYSIDQKQMSAENKSALKAALTEDFYYMDEIRHIYRELFPRADIEEVNPYNLKMMGISVYSRYVLQNHASMEDFFQDLLTREDIIDISAYRKRFVYVQKFSQTLLTLKRNLQIVEFEPNQIISFAKLEQSGVSHEMIRDFCDAVYDYVEEGEYFSAKSLRRAGFEFELYDLGFSDWFYANLLVSDDRFSFGIFFGNLILYKGKCNVTIKSFETNLIRRHGCVDTYDLLSELVDEYGCKVTERNDVIYKVQDTEIYYDRILDRLYANKDLYYKELEEGGF